MSYASIAGSKSTPIVVSSPTGDSSANKNPTPALKTSQKYQQPPLDLDSLKYKHRFDLMIKIDPPEDGGKDTKA
eukprot:13910103-Ditylum_brightwellii.AAC.1